MDRTETALQVFENETFGNVRTMLRDNEPWFVAADVCRGLEIGNPRDAMSRLDDDEKDVASTDTLGGKQNITIISEAGLYTLVLGSRKPEAKAFKRWITHEVIPTIRKTGMYATDALLNNPDLLIKAAERIKAQREQIDQLEADLTKRDEHIEALTASRDNFEKLYQEYRIKNYFTDICIDNGENTSIRETAKEIGVKEREFTQLLVDLKYLYRRPSRQNRLFPYSTPKCNGVFVVKEFRKSGGQTYELQTLVTPAGRAKLTAECVKAGLLPMEIEKQAFEWRV